MELTSFKWDIILKESKCLKFIAVVKKLKLIEPGFPKSKESKFTKSGTKRGKGRWPIEI